MTNKLYISLIGALLTGLACANLAMAAAPPNDVLYSGSCNAVTLPLDGTCVTGESNLEANPDYYGGCINSNNPTVFYTFTLSSGAVNTVDITFTNTGGGTDVELFLFGGTCDAPSGITATCEPLTTTFSFYDLDFGITYYLMVSSNPGGNTISYDICSQEYFGSGTRTGPEQDCDGAIPICEDTYTETISYTGFWNTQEIPTGSTCLFGGENNSVWYVITPQSPGDLYFTITTAKDYDFALYDITTIGCAGIPSATPIRCNYSATAGPTGLTLPNGADPKTPAISVGAMGSPTMEGVNVVVGDVFVLIVDNWTGDNSGFILDFTASTFTLFDGDSPTFVSAVASCTANTITLTMDELIDCFTIVQGDFVLTNTTTSTDFTSAITNVAGSSCGSYSTDIVFTHNGTLTTGAYTITLVTNPVLADKCSNVIANTQTVSFDYLAAIAVVPSVTTVCSGGTVDLNVSGAPPSTANIYTLNPGGTLASSDGSGNATYSGLTPTVSTVYTVSVTYGGCTNTAQTVITVQDNIVVTISPLDPVICSSPGTINLVATTTINGVTCTDCDYDWDAGTFTETGVASSTWTSRPPGTYTVVATTTLGCTSNTASSTVSLAGGGPAASCDVWYVTPAGGGDGLTKTTPIDLATALTNAECTNAVIKMAVGNYVITNFILVKSFITLEGGYINTFADKTSDLTSGNATVIQRSDAVDSDQALRCTAFRVQSSSTDFRFQDLRIELPTTHAGGSGISNYGIYLESGCSGYKIVRCYIDAGTGAN